MPLIAPRHPRQTLLFLALGVALGPGVAPANAEQATASAGPAAETTPHDHQPVDLHAVEVRSSPLPSTVDNLTRPVAVLTGEALDKVKASSIGETLGKVAGVQSSYFGPGVGRPIVRGFDGARVQVVSDGLGTGDVSTVSVDHAVSVEPFLADQIEVLKGPATLLYGSGAIGGAVNVIDGRIPEAATAEPLQGRAELRGGTVNDEKTGMVRVDGTSADGHLVFHFDGLHRETGDYDIPGYAESATLRAQEAAEHEEHGEHEEEGEEAYGTLPNSAVRTDAGAFGLSWVGDRGFIGASYSMFHTRYGVPGHSHEHGEEDHDHDPIAGDDDDHEEHEEEGPVRIDMDQRRSELRAGLDDAGVFSTLRLKAAHTEYTHTEYEGSEVGTVFNNTGDEARLEGVFKPWNGWNNAVGVQWGNRDFEAIGDEAFVPPSQSTDAGVFWIADRQFGPVKLELGARHDQNEIDVDNAVTAAPDRDFDTNSLSASMRWSITDDFSLSFGLDRAQRAPTAEELYSSGLHVATGSVEIGQPNLDVETANRAELGMHWHAGPVRLSASIYHVGFDDFIYQADTGIDDGGPVRVWTQDDAEFNGAEAEVNWTIADNSSGSWDLRVFGDVVRGELSGSGSRDIDVAVPHGDHDHDYTVELQRGGYLPRMAPSRLGGEINWARGGWRASLGAVRYADQDHVAANESSTPGYTLVDAHLAWHVDTSNGNAWEVFVDGSNLLDEEARVHTSFLKELAPLPGRGVAFGVRAFF
ncbi:TonB-dependent receptor [Pseudoxanthomonas dokdonensis]|uniref:Ligand-gated channel n=1 Tax=Pseudoxanthomonas dokdonensis TaxID=344882 RepID=A0A0R0CEI9_9GAMM|nr:TonB-dependent receptor [Pseudoxanthomonas dokdonensis]KRG68188.1 hypothetical protein ABB29_14175 [Pseudoxanthomonas dokdonensis]